ncbi:MAG: NAD(P)-dependent oxidoreductase [Alphaproteobacteria bacterium]|nr:NAD(P)-dependent oxidoreductase [Alphaproteobacteria bacterium]
MTTLIIGGTGFIGASLARKLIAAGEAVVCMDATLDPWHLRDTAAKVALVQGDVAQFDDVARAIAERQADRVVNLAYILSAESENALHRAVRVNLLGMDNVFEAARLAGIKRVVYASSVAFHGANPSPQPTRIDEDSPAQPLGVYGRHKQMNEAMAERYAARYGVDVVAVRPPVVFGPGRRLGQIAHAEMINQPALGHPYRMAASAEARVALIHVDDVAELFFRLVTAGRVRHAAYHTGGHLVSNGELAEIVRRLIPEAAIAFDPPAAPPAHFGLSFVYDHARAQAEFGYAPAPLALRVHETIAATRAAFGRSNEAGVRGS